MLTKKEQTELKSLEKKFFPSLKKRYTPTTDEKNERKERNWFNALRKKNIESCQIDILLDKKPQCQQN